MEFVLVAGLLQFLFLDGTAAVALFCCWNRSNYRKKFEHPRLIKSTEISTDNTDSMEQTDGSVTTVWVTFGAVILTILVIIACGTIARKVFRRLRKTETMEDDQLETSVMLTSIREVADISVSTANITSQFRKELQKNYRHLYSEAQRAPYSKDSEQIFVDGSLKFIGAKQESENPGESGNLNSYKEIFFIDPDNSSMVILEGEPGYGKSTLALQLAHDWCTKSDGSHMNEVDILILLPLRKCQGVHSIYSAIRKFVLPKQPGLTEDDIKSILQHNKSIMFIFDGFDEYPDQEKDTKSDIFKIITKKMFKEFRVVLTTTPSCLPHTYPSSTKRVMLTGLDEKGRENYLRKALIGDDSTSAVKLLEHLKKCPVLNDICQVPFFFVQFAHMSQSNSRIQEQQSVTSFFHLLMSFILSKRNTVNEGNIINDALLIENTKPNMKQIAFEALNGRVQKLIWTKKELYEKLGKKAYEYYLDCGILVEDNGLNNGSTNDANDTESEVQFYHKLLQEWYAAHYLADHLQQNPSTNLEGFLHRLDPMKNQYTYRFACGFSSRFAGKIIEYLKKREGDENFVILCMLEQYENVGNIMETVRELCSEGINISGHDSLLHQRMAMNVLDTAKEKQIPVKGVHLQNAVMSVDLSTPAITTLNDMAITSDTPLKNLSITMTNRNFEEQEAENILEFAAQCQSLRLLVFGSCVPPYSFKISSLHSDMISRKVKVGWRLFDGCPFYILNFDSGRWQYENDGKELTKDDYEKMRLERQDASTMWTEEYNIDMAKADRKYLRKIQAK